MEKENTENVEIEDKDLTLNNDINDINLSDADEISDLDLELSPTLKDVKISFFTRVKKLVLKLILPIIISIILISFIILLLLLTVNVPNEVNILILGGFGTFSSLNEFNQSLTQKDQIKVAEEMNNIASNYKIDYILSTGDNIFENGCSNVSDPLFDYNYVNVYSKLSNIKDIPWYLTLGDQDYRYSPESQLNYDKINKNWNIPSLYYVKDISINNVNIQLIYIDTTPLSSKERLNYVPPSKIDNSIQMKWFKDIVEQKNSTISFRFVIGHHPLYSKSDVGDFLSSFNSSYFEDLMLKNKINAYFSGHDTILSHYNNNGLDSFISGASGKQRELNLNQNHPHLKFEKGSTNGFLHLRITSFETKLKFINNDGTILYSYSIFK